MKIVTQHVSNDIVPSKNPNSVQPVIIKPPKTSPAKPNIQPAPAPPNNNHKPIPPKTSPAKPNIQPVRPPAPPNNNHKPIPPKTSPAKPNIQPARPPAPSNDNRKPKPPITPVNPKPPIVETFWKCASQCQNKFYTFDDYYYNKCWDCVVNCSKRFPNSHTYGFCDCINYSSYFYNGKAVCKYRKGEPPRGGHGR